MGMCKIKQEMLEKKFTLAQIKIAAAIEILKNIQDEAEALEGYIKLLMMDVLDEADVDAIREIMSDEKNHALILQAMVLKYDGKIPTGMDGAEKAISTIRSNLAEAA